MTEEPSPPRKQPRPELKRPAAVLVARRSKLGLSQAAVADHMEVTAPAVSEWERALSWPMGDKIKRLAKFLGLTVAELTPDDLSPESTEALNNQLGPSSETGNGDDIKPREVQMEHPNVWRTIGALENQVKQLETAFREHLQSHERAPIAPGPRKARR